MYQASFKEIEEAEAKNLWHYEVFLYTMDLFKYIDKLRWDETKNVISGVYETYYSIYIQIEKIRPFLSNHILRILDDDTGNIIAEQPLLTLMFFSSNPFTKMRRVSELMNQDESKVNDIISADDMRKVYEYYRALDIELINDEIEKICAELSKDEIKFIEDQLTVINTLYYQCERIIYNISIKVLEYIDLSSNQSIFDNAKFSLSQAKLMAEFNSESKDLLPFLNNYEKYINAVHEKLKSKNRSSREKKSKSEEIGPEDMFVPEWDVKEMMHRLSSRGYIDSESKWIRGRNEFIGLRDALMQKSKICQEMSIDGEKNKKGVGENLKTLLNANFTGVHQNNGINIKISMINRFKFLFE